MAINSAGS